MRLPQVAIQNRPFFLVITLLIVVLGVNSFLSIPKYEDPNIHIPYYTLTVLYPGAAPSDMEELIVDPVEEALNELENIKEISTTIYEGAASILIKGEPEVNIDDQYNRLASEINKIKTKLPDDIQALDFNKYSLLDVSFWQLALISETATYEQMQTVAEGLSDQLVRVPGVREAQLDAYPKQEIHVQLQPQKMANLNIPLSQIMQIIERNNLNIPGGTVEGDSKDFSVRTSGRYTSQQALENTIIRTNGDRIVYLKDIAEIRTQYEKQRYLGRYNGQRCLFLSLTQQEGANVIDLHTAVQATLATAEQALPPSMKLVSVHEQAPAVSQRINGFFFSLLQGVALVVLVITLALGFRSALIIATIIPLSVLAAITLLDISGFGLQQISIAGLIIALGLLVDNGIVVIESIHEQLKQGIPPTRAVVQGTSAVGWPILSATVTTVLAFIPMAMLSNDVGEFLRSLPLTVTFCLLASLLLALTLMPLLAHRHLGHASATPTVMSRLLSRIAFKGYLPLLKFSLRWPVFILFVAAVLLGFSVALFPLVGVSFFSVAEKPVLLIRVSAPEGVNLANTDLAARFVEHTLDTTETVASYVTNVGHGNPRFYYNIFPAGYRKNQAEVLVNLTRYHRSEVDALRRRLEQTFSGYAGAKISVSELKNGPPINAPIDIKVVGDNLAQLKRISKDVEAMMEQTEGVMDIENLLALSKTDLAVDIHRYKAGRLGVPLADIDLAVRAGLSGVRVGSMRLGESDYMDIVVKLSSTDRPSVDDLHRVSLATPQGRRIPLRQLATVRFQPGYANINHYNLERNVAITANVRPHYNVKEVTETIIRQLDDYAWPEGYRYIVSGEHQSQQNSFGGLGRLLIVAALGIFAVLVLQFKSFVQPFIIFTAVPLAFTGSVAALLCTGWSFSFLAFVGFTSLVGIVVNDSIILVDSANQLGTQYASRWEALLRACVGRFKPVVLTSLTTIVGLLPLTLTNSSLWSPMGWTIIGGMVSSTLLILVVVPVLFWKVTPKRAYDLSDNKAGKVKDHAYISQTKDNVPDRS